MPFTVTATALPEVLVLEPRIFSDTRGFFFESYNRRDFASATGIDCEFVQDNHSLSVQWVLRGLHYQIRHPQGKLVRVLSGKVWDVVVDLRRSSPRFGRWVGLELSAQNRRQLWVPPGFAHGILALSPQAELLYKTTDYWFAEHERSLAWNDPRLAIAWPLDGVQPILAAKDAAAPSLERADCFD